MRIGGYDIHFSCLGIRTVGHDILSPASVFVRHALKSFRHASVFIRSAGSGQEAGVPFRTRFCRFVEARRLLAGRWEKRRNGARYGT